MNLIKIKINFFFAYSFFVYDFLLLFFFFSFDVMIYLHSAEEAAWMHLELCMRCLPHDEDTGGFFVATFRKKASADVTAAAAADVTAAAADVTAAAFDSAEPQRSHAKGYVEYHKIPQDNFDSMKTFYSLSDKLSRNEFWFREDFSATKGKHQYNNKNSNNKNSKDKDAEETKAMFYLPPSVQSIIAGDVEGKLKLVSAGVKAAERKTAKGTKMFY